MNNFSVGFVYSIIFLLILLFLEYITRKNNFNKEYTRRVAHLLSGLFAILMGVILEPMIFIAFAITFLQVIRFSYSKKYFSSIHGVERKTYGEILLPLGILVAYLFSGSSGGAYLPSVLILTFADPLAGIFGSITKSKNSYGSIVFFITTVIILLVFFKFSQAHNLILVAMIITMVERFSPYGTDNLTIPLAGSLLIRFLLQA